MGTQRFKKVNNKYVAVTDEQGNYAPEMRITSTDAKAINGAERALVNKESLGATNEEYANLTALQRDAGKIRRQAGRDVEMLTKTDPNAALNLIEKRRQEATNVGASDYRNLLASRLPPERATKVDPLKKIGEVPVDKTAEKTRDQLLEDVAVKRAQGKKLTEDEERAVFQAMRDDQKLSILDKLEAERLALQPQVTSQPTELESQDIKAPISGQQGIPQITAEQYADMTPEQRQAYDQARYQEQVAQEQGALQNIQAQEDKIFQDRIARQQALIDEAKQGLDPVAQRKLDILKQQLDQDAAESVAEVKQAGEESQTNLQNLAARRGFGRSSATANALRKASDTVVKQVSDIEQQANRMLATEEIKLLDQQDQKIAELEAGLERKYDEYDMQELAQLKEQQALTTKLMSQNPSNIESLREAANQIQTQRIEYAKLEQAEQKALRESVAGNFEFMLSNFGGEWLSKLDPESKMNYAMNLGISPLAFDQVGYTLAEQNKLWEQEKYYGTQEYELNKLIYQNDFEMAKMFEQSDLDLDTWKQQKDYEVHLASLKEALGEDGLSDFGPTGAAVVADYGNVGTNITSDSMGFDEPVPHPQAGVKVVEFNPKLLDKYPQNFKFANKGGNDLTGHCKWFSQKLTTLENGDGWKLGSSLSDTKANFQAYANKGQGFKVGQEPIRVGQTLVTSDSAVHGHSAIVNAILPDGKVVVTESNYTPFTVTHDRVVDLNNSKIIGVLKTKVKSEFQIPDNIKEQSKKIANTPAYKNVDKLNNVMQNLLYSANKDVKSSEVERFNKTLKNNQPELAKTQMQSILVDKMSAADKQAFSMATEALNNYATAEKALEKISGLGWYNPSTMASKAFSSVGLDDQQKREFTNTIQPIINEYRSAVTGTAFSDQEKAEIEALFPSINKSYEQNKTDLRALNTVMKNKRDTVFSIASGGAFSTYDDFKYMFEERQKGLVEQGMGAAAQGLKDFSGFLKEVDMRMNYQPANEEITQDIYDSI